MISKKKFLIANFFFILLGSYGALLIHKGLIAPNLFEYVFLIVAGGCFNILGFALFGMSMEMANPSGYTKKIICHKCKGYDFKKIQDNEFMCACGESYSLSDGGVVIWL